MIKLKPEMEEIGSLKFKPVLRVSRHGKGLYLYIPGHVVDVGDIQAGDRIEVHLLRHYRPQPQRIEAPL